MGCVFIGKIFGVCLFMGVCVHVCVYIYVFIIVCVHICVYMFVCVFVLVHVHFVKDSFLILVSSAIDILSREILVKLYLNGDILDFFSLYFYVFFILHQTLNLM